MEFLHSHSCVQIRCGDVYASPAVEKFTKCAVSDKKCVKQRVEEDNPFPAPKDSSLVREFNLKDFTVRHIPHPLVFKA